MQDFFGFTRAIGATARAIIKAVFTDGTSAEYTRASLALLLADPGVAYVIDAETGELLEG